MLYSLLFANYLSVSLFVCQKKKMGKVQMESLSVFVDNLFSNRQGFRVIGHAIAIDIIWPLASVCRLSYQADYLFGIKFWQGLPQAGCHSAYYRRGKRGAAVCGHHSCTVYDVDVLPRSANIGFDSAVL